VRVSLSEYLLAARTGAWLLSLPIRLRFRNLPRFLANLRPASPTRPKDDRGADRTARIVTRVCRLPIFDLPLFPRICLRRSLALYHVLGRMGYPVSLHIGVRKDDAGLEGHSWVTLDGESLGERDPVERFRAIYSYPIEGLSSG
jgi:transglutaminase superfamily protein